MDMRHNLAGDAAIVEEEVETLGFSSAHNCSRDPGRNLHHPSQVVVAQSGAAVMMMGTMSAWPKLNGAMSRKARTRSSS